ncbi:tetratricopeptide repeat protein [Plastoroseomonas arctica]|uniref:Sel1 repeat family protein n=1 Tax=Plastoroseomonas arctica TaxID=1509237 RepID=A0AAF1JVL3_9PROT|nr:tetratricopeptide repeat protein [Plastoroseomonas arctica]MBR0654691.1 sel1 repeat family protein [Plastoroseomonas arctica]
MAKQRRPAPAPPPLPLDALTGLSAEDLAARFSGPEGGRWMAAAARLGHAEAMVMHGQALLDAGDAPGALGWFQAAARAGDAMAQNMVGRCHEMGWGTPADAAAALGWYARAAAAGLDWGQYNLAGLLWRGAGVVADRPQALDWYKRAAAQGHAKALNILGRFLEEGWAGPPDPRAAAELYARAAEGGDFRGQFNLATLLLAEGRVAEAAQWFTRAAAGGTPGFLASMKARLAEREEPELRAIAAGIGAVP